MKFIHMADMHLDSPFATLAANPVLAQERRMEQRQVMRNIVEYIKENNIPYFFIAGDLYEQEYIRKSTIEYINNLFKEIENTHIFITPGNHDPYIKNSFYKQFSWNKNVHIFTSQLECVENSDIDIYGYGFNDFYMKNQYENIEIKNKSKINILITHGSLDGAKDEAQEYNALSSRQLKNMEFDYIALGHIHKKSYNDYENQRIVYPGSTVSLGFDELGARGIIEGNINEQTKKLDLKFIPMQAKTFEEKVINVSSCNSEEDLIENINNTQLDEDKYYKIVLQGKANFEIDEDNILKLQQQQNVIRVRDHTEPKYEIEEIAKQASLKGLFAKNILEKTANADEEEKQKLLQAFAVGMEILG